MTKIILNELEKKIAIHVAKSRYYGNRGKLINQKLVAQMRTLDYERTLHCREVKKLKGKVPTIKNHNFLHSFF